MIDCALITADETYRRQVERLVRETASGARLVFELGRSASDLSREDVTHAADARASVVFVDLGEELTGLRAVRALGHDAPEAALIVAGPRLTAEDLLEVMRAGASEYLPRPLALEETADAFGRVQRRVRSAHPTEHEVRSRVATLFSAKGGVGVTTISVNLAVTLHRLTRRDTLLVDLAPSLGTTALTMGLQPRYSYLDVVQNFHRIDEELFRSFLSVHESGVNVLASPPRPEDLNGPSVEEVGDLLRLCRRHFGYVVVDAGHSLTRAADAALTASDQRILVTTPELPTLRNLRRVIELLEVHASNGKAPARVVLNQYREGVGLNERDVEEGLGLGVSMLVEHEDAITTESINLGRPVVLAGRSKFAKSMDRLGREIADPSEIIEVRGGVIETLMRPFRAGSGGER